MKTEKFSLGKIPTVLYGEKSDGVWLYFHGRCGNKEEASAFAEKADKNGFQTLSIDFAEHGERKNEDGFVPWIAAKDVAEVVAYAFSHFNRVCLYANSIGAWFCLLACQNVTFEKCIFVSPVVDMEKIIDDMMKLFVVSEERLELEKEIPLNAGQTLSYKYLCYAREHKIEKWNSPTAVLYAEHDTLTSKKTMEDFCARLPSCSLTVCPFGEHWFHTPEQLAFLSRFEQVNLIL